MSIAKPQTCLPFFESAENATRHAIEASGKTLKQVGCHIWPDKSADAARTALANALNEARAERLTADQHLAVAGFCDRYDFLYYSAHRCSHSQPSPVTPQAKAAELNAKLFEKADELEMLFREIKGIRTQLEGSA